MATTPATTTTTYCMPCAMHDHSHCREAIGGPCRCGARDHNPDVETAAAMESYVRPDLHRLPVEVRATAWHKKEEDYR